MSSQSEQAAASAAAEARTALRLTRSISATWWYEASAILLFQVAVAFLVVVVVIEAGSSGLTIGALAVLGLLWVAATLPPLIEYRHRSDVTPLLNWRKHLVPFVFSVAYGITAGVVVETWALGIMPLLQVIMLLNWPLGVRFRVALAASLLLLALAAVDVRLDPDMARISTWYQMVFLAVVLPSITVTSLWWWDVLIRLDRARASEARLAATQERLRVASDVHDLQGHHLQVIALQLELAERLMPRDADAGMEQLRAARVSVDEARQGTRDLATRFRSVPLRDELANAVDLLRAADARAEAVVDPDSSLAPASVLGPVIRETTTNVLRHGGGRWARLALTRVDGAWRYEISNDAAAGPAAAADPAVGGGGSGLEGIARRAGEAGGDLEVLQENETFTVIVTVPAGEEDAR